MLTSPMLSGGFFADDTAYSLITLFNRPPQSAGLVKHPAVPIVVFTGNVARTKRTEAGQPETRRFRGHRAGADKSTPAISR